jgi:hypothetical protein
MDFGAADFKMNTSPMFARFDEISQGRLTAAMINQLVRECGAA